MAFSGAPRRVVANAARVIRLASSRRMFGTSGARRWLLVRIGSQTLEQRAPTLPFGLAGAGDGERQLGLLETLRALEAAAGDRRLAGVVLRFHGHLPGWSKALALRRAVDALRRAGVRVVTWSESLSAEDYLVASGADHVWLPPSGSLFLVGLRTEQFFLRGLFENLDVSPEVVRVGSYKGAGEMFTRDAMSPEQREQLEAWLDDLYGDLVAGIARGRSLEEAAVRDCIDGGPYPAPLAVEASLTDACLYPDQVEERLDEIAGRPAAEDAPRWIEAADYFRVVAGDAGWRPLAGELPRIAYVVASGAIHRGSGLRGVTSDAFRSLIGQLTKDDGIRGMVLRVDSPGGDAVASDLVYRALRKLREEKPVVVSMAEVAASGGYYLAAAGDAVFAESGTLTGSIGVVGGKVNLDGLYRRLGVAKDAVERGARAGLLSESRGFTPDERGAVRREMEAVYDTFVDSVAQGRDLPVETVRRLGQGRVWSGLRAQGNGLVDAIGGPLEALRDVRQRAGLRDDERVLLELYPRRPRLPGLRALAGAVAPGLGTRVEGF